MVCARSGIRFAAELCTAMKHRQAGRAGETFICIAGAMRINGPLAAESYLYGGSGKVDIRHNPILRRFPSGPRERTSRYPDLPAWRDAHGAGLATDGNLQGECVGISPQRPNAPPLLEPEQ